MDSLKYVDFLIYGDGKALGTGESYCVLPSHLSLVRGLKLLRLQARYIVLVSHLSLVRGLKLTVWSEIVYNIASHLSLVRGLKPEVVADEENEWRSHLSQVRGLKRLRLYDPVGEVKSHPTLVPGLKCKKKCYTYFESHHTRMRGLKETTHPLRNTMWMCRFSLLVYQKAI